MEKTIIAVGTLATVAGATMGAISPEEIHSAGAIVIGIITSILQLISMFKKNKGGN